eukprot:scaffold419_cov185-Chaetoceros_neogracile.AAC.2
MESGAAPYFEQWSGIWTWESETGYRGDDRFDDLPRASFVRRNICYGEGILMEKVKVVALQAPVSDREGVMTGPAYETNIAHAKKLEDMGQEEEMMPRSAFWAPITASRFLALQDVGGEDDYFSSDFSDEQLGLRLRHMGQRGDQNGMKTLVSFSGEDEYVPATVDKKLLLERLCAAMKSQTSPDIECHSSQDSVIPLLIDTGNHNLSNDDGDKEIFVAAVKDLLQGALN